MAGILIADGSNFSEHETVKAARTAAGAFAFTIGPKRQPVIPSSGGKGVKPKHHFEAFRRTAFGTLYILGGEHIATLKKRGRLIHWVREAFGHLKAIGATGEAVELTREACGVEGMAFGRATDVVDCCGAVTAGGVGNGPSSVEDDLKRIKGAKKFPGCLCIQYRSVLQLLKGDGRSGGRGGLLSGQQVFLPCPKG